MSLLTRRSGIVKPGPTIFVSYRREDTVGHAGRIYDRLAQRFGRDRVYRDIDAIAAGEDFIAAVRRQVEQSTVLLALIGLRWAAASDKEGRPRLADENDLVRIEIATALQRGTTVIPVLLQGATMPTAKDLPENLGPLSHRNAVEIRDTAFDADVARLIEILRPGRPTELVGIALRWRLVAAIALVVAALGAVLTYWQVAENPERVRSTLAQMGIPYDADAFVRHAEKGDVQVVSLFLRAGMAPDAKNPEGQTPLMRAAAQGRLEVARTLVAAGADPDTALPWAARYGHKDTVAFLLDKRPSPLAIGIAMVNAVIHGEDIDTVRMLLDKGADANLKAADITRRAESPEPALIEAINTNRLDIARLLLSRGADVNIRGAFDRSALQVAISPFNRARSIGDARESQIDVVEALVARGAELDARGKDYWQATPLILAVDRELPEIALLLIKRGADVDTYVDRSRRSALMHAAGNGMTEVLRTLLEKGVDINRRNESGDTALHAAARRAKGPRYSEIAEALLAAGAEVNARNDRGETPLMLARKAPVKDDNFAQVLLARGAF
jgi:ankyrin repeat protein